MVSFQFLYVLLLTGFLLFELDLSDNKLHQAGMFHHFDSLLCSEGNLLNPLLLLIYDGFM